VHSEESSLKTVIRVSKGVFIVAFLQFASAGAEGAPEYSQVLSQLKHYDVVYFSRMTAKGVVRYPKSMMAPHLPVYDRTWSACWSAGRFALVEDASQFRPGYIEPSEFDGVQDPLGIAYDEENNMAMSIETGIALSFEDDRTASAVRTTVFLVSPDGEIVSSRANKTLTYHGPNEIHLKVPEQELSWSFGRGFSSFLDPSEGTVTQRDDGLLQVEARGSFNGVSIRGRWVLRLDPARQHLVRHAVYYDDAAPDKARATVSNENIVEDGVYVFPREGSTEIKNYGPKLFQFEEIRFEETPELFDESRNITDKKDEPRILINDYQKVPPDIKYTGDKKHGLDPRAEEEPEADPRGTRRLVVWINVVIICLILAYFVILRLRRK